MAAWWVGTIWKTLDTLETTITFSPGLRFTLTFLAELVWDPQVYNNISEQ